MHHHAARMADGLVPPIGRPAHLVERVPGLVQHRHEPVEEAVLVPAGRDAHVLRNAAAERVQRGIEPTIVEIEAEQPHEPLAEPALRLDREWAVRHERRGSRRLSLQHLADQRRQGCCEIGKDRIDPGRPGAGLVNVHERLVGRQAGCLRPRGGTFLRQRQNFFERLAHAREIGCRTRLAPGHVTGRVGARLGLDQIGRQRGRVHPAVAHLAQVRPPPLVERVRFGFGLVQQIRHLRIDELLADSEAHRRHLLGARAGAAGRHVHLHVPTEQAQRLAQRGDAPEAVLEFGVCVHGAV